MDTEKMIRELRYLQEKHKDDMVFTFGTRWSDVCRDVADKLTDLLQENKAYQELLEEGSYGLVKLPRWNTTRPDKDGLYDATIKREENKSTFVQNVIYRKDDDEFDWEEGDLIDETRFTILAWAEIRDVYHE
jgi:hypothetical protein